MSVVPEKSKSSTTGPLDHVVRRIGQDEGWGAIFRRFGSGIRAGELGVLPVVAGLIVIWTVFAVLNPVFLSPNNLINLLFDCSTVGVIALGVVCVLMIGEIDLSVGSISGLASAVLGVLWVNNGVPPALAIGVSIALGASIGFLYAQMVNHFGMPSFVASLAGLLAFLGLQLFLLGNTGSINLPYGTWLVSFGQTMTMPAPVAHALAAIPGMVILWTRLRGRARRRAAGSPAQPLGGIAAVALLATLGLELAVFYLNQGRGVPWMFGLFVGLVVLMDYAFTRTSWGRAMMAIGGNREAARRAGIKVKLICTSAFMLCAALAASGGILAASRLASSSQQAGTGDVNLNAIAAAVIGGTSLFGGRGSAYSALLGIIVIQSISNGLTLLDMSSSLRYIITGCVLAIAVTIDALARKSRVSHGRA